MGIKTVVGAPVWDRAWCLDRWFDAVAANVDPAETALVFVVPASDEASRDVISRRSRDFAATEVLRDREANHGRGERQKTQHTALARARNEILRVVNNVGPERFVSWDTDFFVQPGTVDELRQVSAGVVGVWAWLNRQAPQQAEFEGQPALWQPPVNYTAMQWDPKHSMRAVHFGPGQMTPPSGRMVLKVDLVLAFQVMRPEAYKVAKYAPHPDDENVPFFAQLHERGVSVACTGHPGVHLYDRHAKDEIQLGYPGLMALADQQPLAVTHTGERSIEWQATGFFPTED